jgi:hypothetical protein
LDLASLPPGDLTAGQREFIKLCVEHVSENDRVICVRLALIADMMKFKEWSPRGLSIVGGVKGIGVALLHDRFDLQSATYCLYRVPAQRILRRLLPEAGCDTNRGVRSRQELFEALGDARQSAKFDRLLDILYHDLRLITPSDLEEASTDESHTRTAGEQYYELTQNYLVPALLEWITRDAKEPFEVEGGFGLPNELFSGTPSLKIATCRNGGSTSTEPSGLSLLGVLLLTAIVSDRSAYWPLNRRIEMSGKRQ